MDVQEKWESFINNKSSLKPEGPEDRDVNQIQVVAPEPR